MGPATVGTIGYEGRLDYTAVAHDAKATLMLGPSMHATKKEQALIVTLPKDAAGKDRFYIAENRQYAGYDARPTACRLLPTAKCPMTPDPIPAQPVATLECRNCGAGAPVDEHFCPQCSRILMLGRHGDYFSFFGLPRRLVIDQAQLERRFRDLSRQFHPDYFYNAAATEREVGHRRARPPLASG